MNSTLTSVSELYFDEANSILHIRMLPGADMSMENTKKHYDVIHKLTGGKKYLALVDSHEYFTMDSDALQFTSQRETIANRIATAHYNSSFGNKLTIDFFRNVLKPHIPVQVFRSKQEAEEWLLSQLK
ncbi:MAG: hypothetical protein HY064_05610 [Bacteroidetes bacterium]|nr:hypothetical protein [Bacteroidota bacterium]